ncbi:hypothetical protein SAMN05216489_00779 [Streptomyces sp. 3213]|nr:hypothetical protein SAMN05216489_00779 [Streptomyces sp. 3213] [Streptomyces sp. 3213.3]
MKEKLNAFNTLLIDCPALTAPRFKIDSRGRPAQG